MKVRIEATQEEFDLKRAALLKALSGDRFDIVKAEPRVKTLYDQQKPAIQLRRAYFTAQNEIMDHYDAEFKKMFDGLKKDIEKIIGE